MNYFVYLCLINKKQRMDNYIVSARKYRPSTFRSVVGQKSLTTTLKNAIQSNKLAHAYLFCGPRGVGKTSCARIFAKTINCLNPTADGEACNACESCGLSMSSVLTISMNWMPPRITRWTISVPWSTKCVSRLQSVNTKSSLLTRSICWQPPLSTHSWRHWRNLRIMLSLSWLRPRSTRCFHDPFRCQIYDFSRISIADMVEHLQYVSSQEG